MIYLTSNRLRVEISEQGEWPNNGYRFDSAAFISNVILDGMHCFTTSEPENLWHPSTHGRGLCCEYCVDYSTEANDGEYFPKLGVGLIPKDGKHEFYRKYPNTKRYPMSVEFDRNTATFVTEPLPCLGIAMKSVKKIVVEDNTITLEAHIQNVGEREIKTREYCHNFFSVDGMAISPDYYLHFPQLDVNGLDMPNVFDTPNNIIGDEQGFAFKRCETSTSMFEIPTEKLTQDGDVFKWTLGHKGARAKVVAEDHIRVSGINIWSVDHIVSPEVFQTISLKPGEEMLWKRIWTFEGARI